MAQQTPVQNRQCVTLNVGGTRYTTTRSTLLSQDNTFFTSLLSQEWAGQGDSQQEFLVDRDGDLFKHILRYMRESHEGQLEVIKTWTETDRNLLLQEANFFGLDHLCRMLTVQLGKKLELKSIVANRAFTEVTDAISQGWNVVNCSYAFQTSYSSLQGWVFMLSGSSD